MSGILDSDAVVLITLPPRVKTPATVKTLEPHYSLS
jgi:hypothetical protein